MSNHLPFAKIPIDIEFTKKSKRGAHVITYGAISYYRVLGLPFPADKLLILRPDAVRYVEITGQNQVNPHIDHSTITSLNCYFEAGGCVTHFWAPTLKTMPIKYPGASTANIYKDTDLCHVCSFRAESGDAYLLNTATIHSVARPDTNLDRRFIQLSWTKASFSEVLNRCKRAYGLSM